MNPGFWRGRRVLVTGHTGFKGGWLTTWLQALGADVAGLSRSTPGERSVVALTGAAEAIAHERADLRDAAAIAAAVERQRPEVVIHLGAQPIVSDAIADPRLTFATNVMGTVNVLEAVRAARTVRVALVVTTDRCYEPRSEPWPYREDEPKGGSDPYSSSKACAELVTQAYRSSFFERLASARSGNLIGGGDWGAGRLVPDLLRAAEEGRAVTLRAPDAQRAWQHVLDALCGYLSLAEALDADPSYAGGWNFGAPDEDLRPVRWIAECLAELWPGGLDWDESADAGPPAPPFLLDTSKARAGLGWRPRWDLREALERTVDWHTALRAGEDMRAATRAQLDAFGAAYPARA
jgi:CDP-glucose 4,6-dehydratase